MSGIEIIVTENYQYVGQVKSRQKHGKGALIFNDGGYYIGDFANDRFYGNGTFNNVKIQMFGIFKNGDFEQGYLTCNGFRYRIFNGYYKNVALNQQNQSYFKYNVQQEYEKSQNKLKQVTILESKEGDTQVVHFKTDGSIVQGKCGLTLNQVAITPRFIYVGEIQNRKIEGIGILVFNDGSVFNGKLFGNKFHGVGTFTFASEIQMTGQFYEGDFYYGNLTHLKTNQVAQVKNYEWQHYLVDKQYGSDKIQDYLYKIQANSKQLTLVDSFQISYEYFFEVKINLPTKHITDTQKIVNQQNIQQLSNNSQQSSLTKPNPTQTVQQQNSNQSCNPQNNKTVQNYNTKQNEPDQKSANELTQIKSELETTKTELKQCKEEQKSKQRTIDNQRIQIQTKNDENTQLQTQITQNKQLCDNIHQNVDKLQKQRDNATIQCEEYETKLDEMLENEKWYNTTIEQLIEEHEKFKNTNLQLNIQIEKYKATINELELKCQNLENTTTEQKNNFQKIVNAIKDKNDLIQKQDLELNTLKQTTQNLTGESENKLKQQKYNHDNEIQSLHQQHQRDVEQLQIEQRNIQQRAEQYAIQLQNQAKQWVESEKYRLVQEFSIKEQTILNQLNTEKQQENLLDDLNVKKQALEMEITKQTAELNTQITALETQLKQKQHNHVCDASEIQKPKQKQEPEVEKKIEPDLVKIIIDLKDYQEQTGSKLIKTLKKQVPMIITAEVTDNKNVQNKKTQMRQLIQSKRYKSKENNYYRAKLKILLRNQQLVFKSVNLMMKKQINITKL
ncbi:MORN_motif [Hexamita inflata]|uniref:MORN motif n=1 Tax=Hexamita inflata TaxID=28002 RepID=A0AA86RZX7_9EUKA|nr:MORN motif [Hexamita inflata]